MRTTWLWLGLTMLMGLPVDAIAQSQKGESSRGLNRAVERLFEHRERLGMTTGQLARVQEIKDTADVRKQPYWRQVMSVRRELKAKQRAEPDMPRSQRDAMAKRSGEQIHRLLDEIRSIDHAAMRHVSKVLTPEQKELLMELVRSSPDDQDRSDRSRGRGDRRD